MDYEELQHRIKMRIWMCNELTEKQADDYARIAVNQMKNAFEHCPKEAA